MLVGVIPVGRGRPDSLRYAVRALERYTPVDFLITVGESPQGVRPDVHYPRPNTASPPIVNTNSHLRFVAERLARPFVWSHDDMFPLQPWTPTVHVRHYPIARHLSDFPNVAGYSAGVREAVAVLRQWGHDPAVVPCGPIHRPILLHPDRILHCLDALGPSGSWLTLYPVLADEVTPAADCKIVSPKAEPRDNVDCVSTVNASWKGQAGAFVRERLSAASRWG